MSHYVSDRGGFLIGNGPRPDGPPVLTVETYTKWYVLYLIKPGGEVEEVSFAELEAHCGDGSPYLDHAPNPNAVIRLANARGWYLDELALELIIGRWELDMYPHKYERET